MRLCIDALRLGGTICPVGGELLGRAEGGAALQRSKVGGDTHDLPVPVTDGIGFTAAT